MKPSFTGQLLLIFILVSSLLAGCATSIPTADTPAPTLDPGTVIAAAVSTVQAQMTEEALRNPSPTPEPTSTPVPTETPVPPTPTLEPTTPPAESPTPTTTAEQSFGPLSAQVLYLTTYPENKREYTPNEEFNLAIGLKNTGTITWEEGYTVKLMRADGEITVAPEAKLGKSVEAGAKAEFNLWAFGSETLGTHTWYFQVYNTAGVAVPGGFAVFSYTSY